MANEGHVGFTAQLVQTKEGTCLFCMSPIPGVEYIGKLDEMLDEMMKDMTENSNDWVMWYECRRTEKQIEVHDE